MTTRLALPESEDQVRNLVQQITNEQAHYHRPNDSHYFLARLRSFFAEQLTRIAGISVSADEITLAPVPPQHEGDFALQVPLLMRDMKRYRGEILPALQKSLSESLDPQFPASCFTTLVLAGPFLNFSVAKANILPTVLKEIDALRESYGKTNLFAGQRVIVEYSSPNMGKSLHVGHLGTTLVGQGLANLFSAAGATVFRVSHLGDWGTPCGMLQIGTKMFHSDPEVAALRSSPSQYYSTIYARFNEAQKENPDLREQAKEAFAQLERGEPEAKSFWTTVRNESSEEFDRLYAGLNIHFDFFLGEAFYEPYLQDTIQHLLKTGLAKQDDSAIVADLEDPDGKEGLRNVLLQKSDGATTYFARDIVALFKRKELFDYDLSLYVVGAEQTLHFRQLFELAKRLGYLENQGTQKNQGTQRSTECAHVPIGLITQKGAKISSRAGGALGAEELQQAIYERAKAQVDESLSEELEDERIAIAQQLTNGALFYNQLLTATGKSTDFNLDKILDMRGKSGAYLQYAAVRGKSILRKVGEPSVTLENIPSATFESIDESAVALIKLLAQLPDVINTSCKQRSPHPLAHFLHEVGQAVNHFYQRVRIKDLESPTKDVYLHLLRGSVQVLSNGLHIMNISVPERM